MDPSELAHALEGKIQTSITLNGFPSTVSVQSRTSGVAAAPRVNTGQNYPGGFPPFDPSLLP